MERTMIQLEKTLIDQARAALDKLRSVLPASNPKIDVHRFTAAHSELYALLELGHLAGSGMSKEASAALLVIEREAAALLGASRQPDDEYHKIGGTEFNAKVREHFLAFHRDQKS